MSQISGPTSGGGGGGGTVTSILFNGGLTSTPDPVTTTGTATIDQTNLTVLDGTVYWDTGTQLLNTTATGTANQVLTSNGAGTPPSYQDIPGTFASSFPGDIGTAIPAAGVLNIIAGLSTLASGSTVKFTGSGNTIELTVTDGRGNNIIGKFAGNVAITGAGNNSLGQGSLASLTSGVNNSALGDHVLPSITTGTLNTAIGCVSSSGSGNNYTGAESNNILINNLGVVGESGVTRIGTNGTQTSCFISGIEGVTVSNLNLVTINTSTSQLGSQSAGGLASSFPTDSGTATPSGGVLNIKAGVSTLNCGSSVEFTGSGNTVELNVTDANNNTIIGKGAGMAAITGTDNIALGHLALSSVGAGSQNIAIGSSAGKVNTQGDNVFLGYNSGLGNALGFQNVAIGTNTLQGVGNGGANVAIGYQAGYSITGADNVAVGIDALIQLGGGFENIGIGRLAGAGFTSNESNNICIGGLVQGTASDGNSIRIGDTTAGSANNAIRIGTTGTHTTCFIAGIEGVSVSNLNLVTINTATNQLGSQSTGGLASSFPTDSGTATPSAGVLNIIAGTPAVIPTPSSSGCGATVQFTGSGDTVELYVTDSNSNTMIGNGAGSTAGANGSGNTVIGFNAMNNYAFASSFNTALGYNCLNGATGGGNTVVGYACMTINHGNSGNILMGNEAGMAISGSNNIGIGNSVMISHNSSACIAIGNAALSNGNAGVSNICIGNSSGSAYTAAEANNIIINNAGVSGESGVTRIGTNGTQTSCYIAGIEGVSVANLNVVTINTSTGQLGSQASGTIIDAYTSVNHAASPYTVLATDYYISVDCSAGTVTLLFPNTATTGRTYVVKDKTGNSQVNSITLESVSGAINFDGTTTYVMNSQYTSVQLMGNSVSYEIY